MQSLLELLGQAGFVLALAFIAALVLASIIMPLVVISINSKLNHVVKLLRYKK